jgi:hypothetical protein
MDARLIVSNRDRVWPIDIVEESGTNWEEGLLTLVLGAEFAGTPWYRMGRPMVCV